MLALKQEADNASRTARLGDMKPGLSKKRLREFAEMILDGNVERFAEMDNAIVQQVLAAIGPLRSLIETQGLEKATALAALFPDVEDAVAAGDLPEVVRLRRQQDQTRKLTSLRDRMPVCSASIRSSLPSYAFVPPSGTYAKC